MPHLVKNVKNEAGRDTEEYHLNMEVWRGQKIKNCLTEDKKDRPTTILKYIKYGLSGKR